MSYALSCAYLHLCSFTLILVGALASNFERFNSSQVGKVVKDKDLTLMISITSGINNRWLRDAARNSWLLPCALSPFCDYRFFVDIMNISATPSLNYIVEENASRHYDMVSRENYFCRFMQERHPYEKLNYGNVFKRPWVYGGGGVPYYNLRGLFKIDWKVCFAKYALITGKMAHYHAYVEDDHYLCTENLLYQLTMLRKLEPIANFRIGDPKWDGFDDNFTLMTRKLAMAFALHYPEYGFNCTQMADEGDPAKKTFLSWGNSWMSRNCDWRKELLEHLNITYIVPWTWKQMFQCAPMLEMPPAPHLVNHTRRPTALPTVSPTFASSTSIKIDLKCPQTAPVVHNHAQGLYVRYEQYVDHVCEYVLVIHKVSAEDMAFLWENSTAHSYHNLTAFFLNDGTGGWHEVLQRISDKEHNCYKDANVTDCLQWRKVRRNLRNDIFGHAVHDVDTDIDETATVKPTIDMYYA